MLSTGVAKTLLVKYILMYFNKPMLLSVLYFWITCLPLLAYLPGLACWALNRWLTCLRSWYCAPEEDAAYDDEDHDTPLLFEEGSNMGDAAIQQFAEFSWKDYCFLAFPAVCDLLWEGGVVLALTLLPPSLVTSVQVGFDLFFTALLSALVRKRKLTYTQVVGLLVVTMGFSVVAAVQVIYKQDPVEKQNVLIGLCLIAFSALFGALKGTAEEYFLQEREMPVLVLMGLEGFYAAALGFGVMLPACHYLPGNDNGHFEDFGGVISVFTRKPFPSWLLVALGAYCVVVCLKATSILQVIARSSVLTRTVFKAVRPILTWAVSLVLGLEVWDLSSSSRAAGCLAILFGVCIYGNVCDSLAKSMLCVPADSETSTTKGLRQGKGSFQPFRSLHVHHFLF